MRKQKEEEEKGGRGEEDQDMSGSSVARGNSNALQEGTRH